MCKSVCRCENQGTVSCVATLLRDWYQPIHFERLWYIQLWSFCNLTELRALVERAAKTSLPRCRVGAASISQLSLKLSPSLQRGWILAHQPLGNVFYQLVSVGMSQWSQCCDFISRNCYFTSRFLHNHKYQHPLKLPCVNMITTTIFTYRQM